MISPNNCYVGYKIAKMIFFKDLCAILRRLIEQSLKPKHMQIYKTKSRNRYLLCWENFLFFLWHIKFCSVTLIFEFTLQTASQTCCHIDLHLHFASCLKLRQANFHFSPRGVQNTAYEKKKKGWYGWQTYVKSTTQIVSCKWNLKLSADCCE